MDLVLSATCPIPQLAKTSIAQKKIFSEKVAAVKKERCHAYQMLPMATYLAVLPHCLNSSCR